MKYSERALFAAVLVFALMGAFLLGFINDRFALRDFSDDAGLMAYVHTASNLTHRLSFHSEDTLFEETIRRPPGYPIFIAFSFLIFGEHLWSIWILHILLFLASITLLWRISARFLERRRALLPPLFFAGWWGSLTQIFVVNVEIAAWFLFLCAFWSFMRYHEEKRLRFALGFGGAFAWFVLIKPVFLYAFPILIGFLIWQSRPFSKAFFRHVLAAVALFALFVGSWSFYSYRLLGTFQLASGGLTITRRADDVLLSRVRLKQFFFASLTNDYVADRLFPGYAENPDPLNKETLTREKMYEQRLLPNKSNEALLQKEVMSQAQSLITQAPVKFILTSFPYFMRLNRPLTLKGGDVDHLFVGTHPSFSMAQKTAFILTFLGVWYFFVIGTFFAIIQRIRKEGFISKWTLPLAFIMYTNGIYALLSHAEARYLFPAIPFYFLFFSAFIVSLFKTKALRVVPDSMIENRGLRALSPTTRDFSHTTAPYAQAHLQTCVHDGNHEVVALYSN